MKAETQIILEDYSQKFNDYQNYIEGNNWSTDGDLDGYDLEHTIVNDIVTNLNHFKNEIGEDINSKKVSNFFKNSIKIINTHIDRVEKYLKEYNWSTFYKPLIEKTKKDIEDLENEPELSSSSSKEIRELKVHLEYLKEELKKDMVNQSSIFTKTNKIKVNTSKLNIDEDGELGVKKSLNIFFKNQKATLFLREFLCEHVPIVKDRVNALEIDFNAPSVNPSTSNEFLINMKDSDIPPYDKSKHFFEQDLSTIQFWEEERRKISNGLNVGGYFIHPWLYFHLNAFKIANAEDISSKPTHPDFRDNEYFFAEMIKQAEEDGRKAVMMYGSRRIAKSTTMSSYVLQKLFTILNAQCTVQGFVKTPDLDAIEKYINVAVTNMHPALNINANNLDFDSGVVLGLKESQQVRLDYSTLTFVNLEGGTKKSATQKTAGTTPNGFLFDEIGKGACIKPWRAATPSFVKKDGDWRTVPLLSGCVCAGTKVYNHKGELVNIEDLTQDEGILGFNQDLQEISKEPITWMQPPSEKPCYRITTRKKHVLECSYEHPILVRHREKREKRNGKYVRKIEFIPTEELKIGQQIVLAESVDIWGENEMWEPRLIGWLIGDGDYIIDNSPRLSSCDYEINDYVLNNFEVSKSKPDRLTKDGNKVYMENRIKGICPKLKELGIYGQTKCDKTLPKNLYKYSKESLSELLGGLFDTDGHVTTKGNVCCIGFNSKCENLIIEVRDLLNKFGIHPTYNLNKCKPTKLVQFETYVYTLTISDKKSIETFYNNIKFKIKYKQDALEKVIKINKNKKSQIPEELDNCRLDTITNIEYIGIKPIYNLTAGSTNTYIANSIVTHNTAGESSVSKDAEKMLKNPEDFDVLPMNWDLLENFVDPEWVTWNKDQKFAFFVPAQLSLEAGLKDEKTFAEFLGLPQSNPLEKIKIHSTNWEMASTKFRDRREAKKSDIDSLATESNSFPITPEDCYLTTEVNKFPGIKAKIRKDFVEQEGIGGVKVILTKNTTNDTITVNFTDKPAITDYPYEGGNIDAPIEMLEILEEGYTPPLGLYTIGFDDVKYDKSDGDSVISATVFKRGYEGGEWANRIVAWYDSRPEKKEYYKQLFLLMRYYNARMLAENADNGFIEFLEDLDLRNGTNYVMTHISEGVGLASEDNLHRNKNRKYGWAPTGHNIYNLELKIVMYTKADGIVLGDMDDLEGIDIINHPMLLEELYKYKKDKNADRIRSFGLALTLAQYYDKTYQYMKPTRMVRREDSSRKNKKIHVTKNGLTFIKGMR